MRAEQREHNESTMDVSNGYRPRKVISNNMIFELRVPRSRYHHFYPVLLAVLKSQQREMEELAFKLYGSGLTTEQVGDIFKDLYGKHSTSQVSCKNYRQNNFDFFCKTETLYTHKLDTTSNIIKK